MLVSADQEWHWQWQWQLQSPSENLHESVHGLCLFLSRGAGLMAFRLSGDELDHSFII